MTASAQRLAVVTGAAGLIGAEICAALTRRGARVVAIDVVSAAGTDGDVFCADVTDPEAVAQVAARVEAAYGHVDWLVHAAALTARTRGRALVGELASLDLDLWNELLDGNLSGALVCVQRFLPLLRRSPAPRVLLVGSIQGIVPTFGTGAYGVSKAALAALTRQLAAELARDGVAVNMLAPGPIAAAEERAGVGLGPTPMGRFGSPEEVAGAVCCLMDESFGYMTGAVIPFDGGEHLRPREGPERT